MSVCVNGLNTKLKSLFESYPDRCAIILLVITNFVCNHLFLFSFKYYSDDWSTLVYHTPISVVSVSEALLDSQRPISSILFLVEQCFSEHVLLFHLVTFISTSIFLIVIYYIFKKIFLDSNYTSNFYPFAGAIIFCVLFNKDQIYPWAILCHGFGYIAPVLAIYFYLFKEKKNYLLISLTFYFLSLMAYEVGVLVPFFLFGYDYLRGKDWKKSFYFAIPLIPYLLIRMTNWFGYGSTIIDRGMGSFGLGTLFKIIITPIYASIVFGINTLYSCIGYIQMNLGLVITLLFIDLILLLLVFKYLKNLHVGNRFDTKILCSAFLFILTFMAPYVIRGGMSLATREYYLFDIGIALLIVCALMLIKRENFVKLLLLFIIITGIIINQGLFYNWVVSGNIQNDIDIYIEGNADELSKYDYIYFNTTSFKEQMPNEFADDAIFGDLALYQKFEDTYNKLFGISYHIPGYLEQYDYGYNQYFNAPCLDKWALQAMLNGNRNSEFTLIYGNYLGIVPVNVTKDTIIYKNLDDNILYSVDRVKVFEINYTNVYKNSL